MKDERKEREVAAAAVGTRGLKYSATFDPGRQKFERELLVLACMLLACVPTPAYVLACV